MDLYVCTSYTRIIDTPYEPVCALCVKNTHGNLGLYQDHALTGQAF